MEAISESRKRKIPNVVLVMSEISRVGGWEFQGTYTRTVNVRRLHPRVKARQVYKMLVGFALPSGASRDRRSIMTVWRGVVE
jgi:hypothetical protein